MQDYDNFFRNVTMDNSTMNVDKKLGFVVDVSLTDLKSTQNDEGIHKLFVKCIINNRVNFRATPHLHHTILS